MTMSTPPVGSMSVASTSTSAGCSSAEEGRVRHGDRRGRGRAARRRRHARCRSRSSCRRSRCIRGSGCAPLAVKRKVPPSKSGVSCASVSRARGQPDRPRSPRTCRERIDAELLAGGGEGDERIGDQRHVARRAHRDRRAGRRRRRDRRTRRARRCAPGLAAVLVEHDDASAVDEIVSGAWTAAEPGRTGPIGVDPVAEHRRARPARRSRRPRAPRVAARTARSLGSRTVTVTTASRGAAAAVADA